MTHISKIEIEKFRGLNSLEIDFCKNLNVIAWQNWTHKTSILWLIGHVFRFSEFTQINWANFETEFSEIFKFAYPQYDKAGDHKWRVHTQEEWGNSRVIPASSYNRTEGGKNDWIRVKVSTSTKGWWKFHFPVIYLGLWRLFPINWITTIKSSDSILDQEYLNAYQDLHNDILLMNETITPKNISTSNKKFLAVETERYNHLWNSAGQDNIGQIITALLSFKKLQKEQGQHYKWGVLLIDEIDASLFPAAQLKLIEVLRKKSLELRLQIFFTTHSLEILSSFKSTPAIKRDGEMKSIFLHKKSGKIIPAYDLDYKNVRADLLVLGPDAFKKEIEKKRNIYCEDDEAKDMFINIVGDNIELKNRFNIYATGLGSGELVNIFKQKIPHFEESIIILDWDHAPKKGLLTLPGEGPPDKILYKYLHHKDETDNFWKQIHAYSHQFCFKNFNELKLSWSSTPRVFYKEWYREQSKHWKRNRSLAWKNWITENKEVVDLFISDLKKLLA